MSAERKLSSSLSQFFTPGNLTLVLALVTGLSSGLLAVGFQYLLQGVQGVFSVEKFSGSIPWFVIAPALGGLLVGPIIYWLAPEAKGSGVPEVIQSVAVGGSRLRARAVPIKAIASALTIGSGGSAGREGPIIQIGASLGSTIGRVLNLPEKTVRNLVGCGAAAGIAAAFNTPITGVIFAQEVILGEFAPKVFGMLVVSAVAGASVSRAFLGDAAVFSVPAYQVVHQTEFLFYALLGVAAGLLGVFFSKFLYSVDAFFTKIKIPPFLIPALGGLATGLIALRTPQVLGVGYEAIESALQGQVTLSLLVTFLLLKLATTCLTIGSGGSGGIFAPSLFLGAMLGGTAGRLAGFVFPDLVGPPGVYALIGMSGVLAATTGAPIQALMMVFEMTRDYHIILPLMITCVTASLVAGKLSRETIFTMKLARRGIKLREGKNAGVLQEIMVSQAMTRQVTTVQDYHLLRHVIQKMQETRINGFPVMDSQKRLVGIITLADVRRTMKENPRERPDVSVETAMTRSLIVIHPEATLNDALLLMGRHQVERLLVVSPTEPSKLMGVITVNDIARSYDVAVVTGTKREDFKKVRPDKTSTLLNQ